MDFQVFLKPAGSRCNMACHYCYYLDRETGDPGPGFSCMDERTLEAVIIQHRDASPDPEIQFSWHGGEPTILGLDYFRRIVETQRRLIPPGRTVLNGIQTNGTLIDEEWAWFLAEESFYTGISLDGPRELHDVFRRTRDGGSAFDETIRGLGLLKHYGAAHEVLCVVSSANAKHPLEIYRFLKSLGLAFISFIPLVEPPDSPGADRSVPADLWGDFLCEIFDEWKSRDIGRIKVQIFEEALRTAFGQEHSLCIFKKTCGRVPVIERDGDFYSCDHFVDEDHRQGNIMEVSLAELLSSPQQQAFGRAKWESLPEYCRECEVLESCYGGCPKNRFMPAPGGQPGLNVLCAGYKKFFIHCRPFVEEVAAMWRERGVNPGNDRD